MVFNKGQANHQEQATLIFANWNHGGVCRREREVCLFHSKNFNFYILNVKDVLRSIVICVALA